jgi:cobalt-precorrin-5B (C1)-methyltransferase
MANRQKNDERRPKGPLKRGWTTGACATAAATAAYQALLTGQFPDPVTITLPKGEEPSFPLKRRELGSAEATASVVKDAGDDPDVTHGAEVVVSVAPGERDRGVTFLAGEGVGRVTRPGLALPVGEPAINPGPRAMMESAVGAVARRFGGDGDVKITVSIPGGEALARKTMNGRLGILGGLSILGTTGVVIPYSCASWIHSIHRGVDVAIAGGHRHVAAATGASSEAAVQKMTGLPDVALIDMGDFVGGLLKYLRKHPVERLTIAGGVGKMTKLAQGAMDLHSSRSRVDMADLAAMLKSLGAPTAVVERARKANTAAEMMSAAEALGLPLGDLIARRAREAALATLSGGTAVEIAVFDREGNLVGHAA